MSRSTGWGPLRWVAWACALLIGACGGEPETPAGTVVLSYDLASAGAPSAAVRAGLVAAEEPARVSEPVVCREATVSVDFTRRTDRATGALYMDAIAVVVRAAHGGVVTARRLNPVNVGTAERPIMSLPIVVHVAEGRGYGECSFQLRADGPTFVRRI